MLDIHIGGIRCKISLLFPAVLLLLLLNDKSGIAAFGFLSALIHECGHMTALLLFGSKPASLTVSVFGMRITLPDACRLSERQMILVFAAGPLVNILCAATLFILRTPPVYVWTHLLLATVNGLPVMPLDGGQVVMTVLRHYCKEETALVLMRRLHAILCVILCLLGVAVLRYSGYNFTLLFLAVYVGLLGVFCKTD